MFSADLFSSDGPGFREVAGETASEVARALSAWSLAPDGPVQQCGGLELNSNNFRVITSVGPMLCKRVPSDALVPLRRKLALAAWLADRSGVVPKPRAAADGALAVVDESGRYAWCLWPFITGTYFRGGDDEVRAAGVAAGSVHAALAGAPAELWPPSRWVYEFADLPVLIERVRQDADRWASVFGPAAASLLPQRLRDLPSRAAYLTRWAGGLYGGAWQPCHGDLHPHNVLMHQGQVAALIDVDSLVIAPYPVAAGFARYKLVRQAASIGGAASVLGGRFAEALRRADRRPGLDDEALQAGAQAELLRRFLLVLRLHYLEGDSRWNHVLGVHLMGFLESEAIGAVC